MPLDTAETGDSGTRGAVVGSLDGGLFLVADVSRDDAWMAVSRDDAPVLTAYR